MYIYIYIYIYIHTSIHTHTHTDLADASVAGPFPREPKGDCTANFRPKILDFGGFDSSRILISRGGILMSKGNLLDI